MTFYTKTHKFYCGIDLHAKSMYLCIINQEGETMSWRKRPNGLSTVVSIVEEIYYSAIETIEHQ